MNTLVCGLDQGIHQGEIIVPTIKPTVPNVNKSVGRVAKSQTQSFSVAAVSLITLKKKEKKEKHFFGKFNRKLSGKSSRNLEHTYNRKSNHSFPYKFWYCKTEKHLVPSFLNVPRILSHLLFLHCTFYIGLAQTWEKIQHLYTSRYIRRCFSSNFNK